MRWKENRPLVRRLGFVRFGPVVREAGRAAAALAIATWGWATLSAQDWPRVPPTEPQEAAKTLHLQDGFRAELVAAEPMVTDPIAMQYDENGWAYVIEMNDYPYSDKSHDQAWQLQSSEPLGRVRLLKDIDGDGIFDQSTVFADKLSWPSGVAVWKGGIYVTATPDLWYLKDSDGDGRADIRRKVFTGFRKYNVQAVMNNLQWGLDHRIYAAGSSNGGQVQAVGQSADGNVEQDKPTPTVIRRNDFRFDPQHEQFEAISGGARFGHTQDDWGNRFLCDIRNPVQHVVLPSHYLERNPFLPAASARRDVVDSGDTIAVFQISPPETWRSINAQRLAANTATKSPFDSTVPKGYITSSSGITLYRGAAYPEEYYGNAFIGEVAGNLVMRYRLTADGISFAGQRAHSQTEFLASTDNWFRPVNFVNAPDGMLHVLDMYRETIEHPWSMPEDLKAQVDLTSGKDRGRIYRLLPPQTRPGFVKPPVPRLGEATVAELVAELENPNSWWRETAHRLLFERQDSSAAPGLRRLLRDSESPQARLHALWSLEGLQVLADADLRTAMADADPHLREHAIRLIERRLGENAEWLPQVVAAAADEDARVRFQAAFTLGEVNDPRATSALATLVRRDAADALLRTAVLSSVSHSTVAFLMDLLQDQAFAETAPGLDMVSQLAFIVGARNVEEDIDRVLQQTAKQKRSVQRAIVGQLGAGLRRAKRDLSELAADDSRSGGRLVANLLDEAQQLAGDTAGALQQRLQAIELLNYQRFELAEGVLGKLLNIQEPPEIQLAAIRALTASGRADIAAMLLDKYPTLTPGVQAEVVDQLLRRADWVPAVFDAMLAGVVPASRVSESRRSVYLQSGTEAIRQRAEKLFSADAPGPRKDVLDEYQPALTLTGDSARGEQVFQKNCANCHRFGNQGIDVGPSLATVQNRSASQLLVNILDPSSEVSPDFLEYIVLSLDGQIATGVIVAENASSITLRQAEAKELTILREDIEEMRSSGKSLMPEGLEKVISPQQMADLLAYLLPAK